MVSFLPIVFTGIFIFPLWFIISGAYSELSVPIVSCCRWKKKLKKKSLKWLEIWVQKKKRPLDYYFYVIDEVKHAYSFYIHQEILSHFLRDYRVTPPGEKHFVECLPCNPSYQACHIAKISDDKEPDSSLSIMFYFPL